MPPDVEDLHDIRMINPGDEPRFVHEESAAHVRVTVISDLVDLDGDASVEGDLAGLVDGTHSASADQLEEEASPEHLADDTLWIELLRVHIPTEIFSEP